MTTDITIPDLTGTPKQIEWAKQIRTQVANELAALPVSSPAVACTLPPMTRYLLEIAKGFVSYLAYQTRNERSAGWWIDMRDDAYLRSVRILVDEIGCKFLGSAGLLDFRALRDHTLGKDALEMIEAEIGAAVRAADIAVQPLPPLTGSDRQIEWADALRTHYVVRAQYLTVTLSDEIMASLPDGEIRTALDAATAKDAAKLTDAIAQTEARWWIDNRRRHWQIFSPNVYMAASRAIKMAA